MLTKSFSILLLLCTMSVIAIGQQVSSDGYWWKEMTVAGKVGYVTGYAEGAGAASTVWDAIYKRSNGSTDDKTATAIKNGQDYTGARIGQLVDGLDEFYKDFKNMQIHAADAIYVVKEQAKGTDQKILDDYIRDLRGMSSKPNIRA